MTKELKTGYIWIESSRDEYTLFDSFQKVMDYAERRNISLESEDVDRWRGDKHWKVGEQTRFERGTSTVLARPIL